MFWNELQNYSSPEMQRCPLERLILQVKVMELGSPIDILGKAIQPPEIANTKAAMKVLLETGSSSVLFLNQN